MFATLKKTLAAGAVLAVSAASAQALTVKFDQNNMGFGQGPIVVKSTDGKTWSKIQSSNLQLPFAVFIGHNSRDYNFRHYSVSQSGKKIYQSVDMMGPDKLQHIGSDTAPGSTANFDTIAKMNLRDACNQRLEIPGAIHEDQHLYFNVPLSMVALFERNNGERFTRTAYGHTKVPVICKGVPKRAKQKPLRITRVSFQAYAADGISCPIQRTVRLKIEGDRVGSADVVVMRDDGKKIEKTVAVGKHGEGAFVRLESTMIQKSETRKYHLMIKGTKITVGWKKVAIKCSVQEDDRPDQVVNEQRPNLDKPATTIVGEQPKAPVIVINPPKRKRPAKRVGGLKTPPLVCIGGKVKLNNCYCKPSYKKLKIGAHAYRCIRMVTNKKLKRAKPARTQQTSAPAQQQNRPFLKLLKNKR